MTTTNTSAIDDKALATKIQKMVDALERLNDAVGDTPIRHAVSERVVEIRLLIRDGHLKNMNGGRGPRAR
jgi:hypothetical protein